MTCGKAKHDERPGKKTYITQLYENCNALGGKFYFQPYRRYLDLLILNRSSMPQPPSSDLLPTFAYSTFIYTLAIPYVTPSP